MLLLQELFSTIALFVRIEHSICRFPPNRANGVVVFERRPIRYNIALIERLGESKYSRIAFSESEQFSELNLPPLEP